MITRSNWTLLYDTPPSLAFQIFWNYMCMEIFSKRGIDLTLLHSMDQVCIVFFYWFGSCFSVLSFSDSKHGVWWGVWVHGCWLVWVGWELLCQNWELLWCQWNFCGRLGPFPLLNILEFSKFSIWFAILLKCFPALLHFICLQHRSTTVLLFCCIPFLSYGNSLFCSRHFFLVQKDLSSLCKLGIRRFGSKLLFRCYIPQY